MRLSGLGPSVGADLYIPSVREVWGLCSLGYQMRLVLFCISIRLGGLCSGWQDNHAAFPYR
jgi:hypothetical protein